MNQELKSSANEKLVRSFGRIKSRKLSSNKKRLINELLPKYLINQNFNLHGKNILEIGFGFGDFIFYRAKKYPQISFYGCEPHINGVANLLNNLEKDELLNIKISREDIRHLIKLFPDNFFDEIYILFPDPWPKIKHFKRRLISVDFLDSVLFKKIKDNSKIMIATDHNSYKTWILNVVLNCKHFKWLADSKYDWKTFPNDWLETKYQKKAIEEGREPSIYILQTKK
jgi:tRNA (guanine-N7-)-methyltransferase